MAGYKTQAERDAYWANYEEARARHITVEKIVNGALNAYGIGVIGSAIETDPKGNFKKVTLRVGYNWDKIGYVEVGEVVRTDKTWSFTSSDNCKFRKATLSALIHYIVPANA